MNHQPAYREFHSVSPQPYAEVHSLERWSRELTRRLLRRKSVRIWRLIKKNSRSDSRDYNLGQLRVRGLFQYGKSGTSNHPRSPIRQHLAQHVEKKWFIVNDKLQACSRLPGGRHLHYSTPRGNRKWGFRFQAPVEWVSLDHLLAGKCPS